MTKMETEIDEAVKYLKDGGLGEVFGLADMTRQMNGPKVQMDTSMALALCLLLMASDVNWDGWDASLHPAN